MALCFRGWLQIYCALQGAAELHECARCARPSAPGPDGLRSAAWACDGAASGATLARLLQHTCDTGGVPA